VANNEIIPGFDDEKDEGLRIKLQVLPGASGCLLLVLTGYIDTYNSSFFQKQVQKVIDSGCTRLIFNCEGLNYVSSTGIGSFTAFLKAVKPRGGDLVLLEVQPKVYEVFQLLGFSQFFTIKDNLDDAIAYFHGGAGSQTPLVFPLIFSCPVCARRLKAVKPGRFRCSECKSILGIDEGGKILLG
jgi:anti-anti-sigma factor